MKNGIFKLDWATVADAVLTAVATALLVSAYGLVTTHGFDVFSADWGTIGKTAVNLSVITGVTSLVKDLLSTNSGSLLGIGPASTPSQG